MDTGYQRKYIYFVVFMTGMTALAVELTASRLVGTIYGNSNLVWASIIGLILIFLAGGYLVGGRIADRYPRVEVFYQLLAWGGFCTGLIPVAARPILHIGEKAFEGLELGILAGSFISVLILFCIPVTLLGTISPFAVRLMVEDARSSGKVAGELYSISTAGSFIGTFLPVLVLIPLIGTDQSFYLYGLICCITALAGMLVSRQKRMFWVYGWMIFVLVGLSLISREWGIKNSKGQIYETESAYNYIEVLQVEGYRYLRLNEGQGIHSVWHATELFYAGPWEQFLAGPFFNPPTGEKGYGPENVKRVAIIGLAAGTTARQATAVFGAIPIDGYEIDGKIIEVGRRYFGMNLPNLNAIAEDGRWGIAHSQNTYQLIAVDAYRPPYIPWHLTTVEFFQILHDHLSEDGVVAINVGRAPHDRQLIEGFTRTLLEVFPSVYVMDLPGTFNSILYATKQPTKVEYFYQNLLAFYGRNDIHPLLVEVMQRYVVYQQEAKASEIVFTDDKAPIEWMTNNLMLKFILSGEMESLE